jgi:hypothetical protein
MQYAVAYERGANDSSSWRRPSPNELVSELPGLRTNDGWPVDSDAPSF